MPALGFSKFAEDFAFHNWLWHASFQSTLDKIGPTVQSNSMEMTTSKDRRFLLTTRSPESLKEGSLSFPDGAPTPMS